MAAIADIHGNKPALDAVLEDLPPIDRIVCAGDVVGYNPWPADCISIVRNREIPTVQGNHDRAVAEGTSFRFNPMAQSGVEFAKNQLSAEDCAWLADLPERRTTADGRVAIVHGHPDDPNRYTYPESFGPALLGDEELLVLGHTHVQHAERYPKGIVLNPGSVGQPRDGDRRAAYAVVDLDERRVDLRRVEYDIDAVIRKIEAAGLPRQLGERLRHGE